MSPQYLRRCKELTLDCWWPPKVSTPAWLNIAIELRENSKFEDLHLSSEMLTLADLAESELPSWL